LDTGQFIGQIECLNRGWMLSAHTLQTRQTINAMIRSGEMWVPEGGDPITVYLKHLEKKATLQATARGKTQVSADASAVADGLLAAGATSVPRNELGDKSAREKVNQRVLIAAHLPPNWE